MKCTFCAKKISYFRSFVDSQFCCPDHKQQEADRMRKLALERLFQSTRDMEIAHQTSSELLARSA